MSKTAFLFSGQGAQYVGMLSDIYAAYPEVKSIFEKADIQAGYPLSDIIFSGPEERLNQTVYTQPALLICETAIFTILKNRNCHFDYLEGFSLGEWAALLAANVISFEEAISVIQKRAEYMQAAVPLGKGGMAVVLNQPEEIVLQLCQKSGEITPANYNCPGQITVAGTESAVQTLLQIAEEMQITARRLAVSVPSHCMLMKPAAVQLEKYLEKIPFSDADTPIVMNYNAKPEVDKNTLKEHVILQLTHPVLFEKSIVNMLEQGIDVFVEIGPGKTLTGLVKRIAKNLNQKVTILKTGTIESLEETLRVLSGESL